MKGRGDGDCQARVPAYCCDGEFGMGVVSGGPGYDPEHQRTLEELLIEIRKRVTPGWHQTWWGVTAIALATGTLGGLVVMIFTPR